MSSKRKYQSYTYKSNSTFFTEVAVPIDEDNDESILEEDVGEITVVLPDLETSGFEANGDTLQIAAKCGRTTFSTYVNASRQVSVRASAANVLVNCNDLVYHGVKAVPVRLALVTFIEWLGLFKSSALLYII